MNKKIKLVIGLYFLYLFVLNIFSYTQVDLNLTLFGFGPYLKVQEKLTQLGYFNRPLNTAILLVLLILSFIFWLFFVRNNKKFSLSQTKKIILITGLLLVFAYPIFSHDIFNYIFDARIFTKYRLNPYQYKALDFSNDPWTRFMHWTHRTNPYPVFWTLYTFIPSILGLQIFSFTFYLFKLFVGIIPYYLACFFIYKISKKYFNTKKALFLFAFSPLVIFEFLINSHNDLLMVSVMLFSLYKLMQNKKIQSFFGLTTSVLVKYATAALIPVYVLKFFKRNLKKENILKISFWLMFLIMAVYSYINELQIWYLIWIFPLSVLLFKNTFYLAISFLIQLMLFFYHGYLYFGEWKYGSLRLLFFLVLLILALGYKTIKEKYITK